VQLGGKVILRSSRRLSAVVGATGTLYARNNPPDSFSIGVGVNYLSLPPEEE
jgi:hypothetical protein